MNRYYPRFMPNMANTVENARRATVGYHQIQRLNGLDGQAGQVGFYGMGEGESFLSKIPTWAYWAAGGVAAGAAVGYLVWRKKKGRR